MKKSRYDLIQLFCLCDNLIKFLNTKFVKKKGCGRPNKLSTAELLTLSVFKHLIGQQTIKSFYDFLCIYHANDFNLPSYAQFNENLLSTSSYVALVLSFLEQLSIDNGPEFFIVDSTPIPICANAHRYRVRIGQQLAGNSKNLNGWYHGFKLHIVITNNMDIVAAKITSASVADSKALNSKFLKNVNGFLVGDKGYLGKKLAETLSRTGITLITKARKNMKQPPATFFQIRLLKNRIKVETAFSLLKHQLGLIARHARSLTGLFTNILSALVAYGIKRYFHKIIDLIAIRESSIS